MMWQAAIPNMDVTRISFLPSWDTMARAMKQEMRRTAPTTTLDRLGSRLEPEVLNMVTT